MALGEVGGDQEKWHHFDFKAMLTRLIGRQETLYGIQVELPDSRGRSLAVVQPRNSDEELYVRAPSALSSHSSSLNPGDKIISFQYQSSLERLGAIMLRAPAFLYIRFHSTQKIR